jgi:hypothetical protein
MKSIVRKFQSELGTQNTFLTIYAACLTVVYIAAAVAISINLAIAIA